MAPVIYTLCALTAIVSAWLILKAYRRRRTKLLLWVGLFFSIQVVNNLFLLVDKLAFPNLDMSLWRYSTALVAFMVLLYGVLMRVEE